MGARTVQYRRPDGTLTSDRAAAIRVTPGAVAAAVAGSICPVSYYQGTAKHEAAYAINEVDTEPSGFKSYGIFQISDEEAQPYGGSGEWWTLEAAARVFVKVAEKRAATLAGWANVTIPTAPRDLWAFLALYHNEGGGPALAALHHVTKAGRPRGLDWSNYVDENPGAAINSYGKDCMPGVLEGPSGDRNKAGLVVVGVLVALAVGIAVYRSENPRRRRSRWSS